MKQKFQWMLTAAVVVGLLCPPNLAWARGFGGGGGMRGGGGFAGGGMRGGMGGGMARPMPSMNRSPSFSAPRSMPRPSYGGSGGMGARPGGVSPRPSTPSIGSRPSVSPGSRPNISPGSRPGNVDFSRPGISSRPSTLPGTGTRPGIGDRPGTRPGIGDRPSTLPGTGSRPGIGDRPTSRPGIGDRPSTLPGTGTRPGIGERPGIAGRPGIGERPVTLPGLGNRPGIADRPGIAERPNFGEGGRFENRQDWVADRRGNVSDRRNDLQNRMENRNQNWEDWRQDRWDHRDNVREDWQDWADQSWNNHSDWHHGYWHGNYGDWWHHMWDEHPGAMAFGLTAWGVNRLNYWFGYYPYYNPYYYEAYPVSSTMILDYSQPLTVYEQAAYAAEPTPAAAPESGRDPALEAFDQARQAFRDGNFDQALVKVNQALATMPDDAVLHEFRALVLFATGKYRDAAAGLHAVLAVGPGWDWTTLISMYPNVDVYTDQLRALETARDNDPNAPELRLLLAYHYLTAGHNDAAATQLKKLVELQPKDQVARQLLEMVAGPDAVPGRTAVPPPSPGTEGRAAPSVDPQAVVGTWKAQGTGGASYDLTLTDSGQFTWIYSAAGHETKVTGVYALDGDELAMEPDEGGVMLATITPPMNNKLHFQVIGSPDDDPGLEFQR